MPLLSRLSLRLRAASNPLVEFLRFSGKTVHTSHANTLYLQTPRGNWRSVDLIKRFFQVAIRQISAVCLCYASTQPCAEQGFDWVCHCFFVTQCTTPSEVSQSKQVSNTTLPQKPQSQTGTRYGLSTPVCHSCGCVTDSVSRQQKPR